MKRLEELNREIRECSKCRLHETRKNALCGEGNQAGKLMLVAQAPGEKEDREGRMFIGPSGKKLDDLLETAGVDRRELYMTNLVKCMLPEYRNPKQDEIEICSPYLDREIELINPDTIVALGYYSTRYILQKHSLPVPNPKSQFSKIYGRIFLPAGEAGMIGRFRKRRILPLRHPAVLLYNDSAKEEMMKNYGKLRRLMVDCKWFPVCPLKRFYEKGRVDGRWIELYCKGDWESCVRYWMEEKGETHPDWMLPDGSLDQSLCN